MKPLFTLLTCLSCFGCTKAAREANAMIATNPPAMTPITLFQIDQTETNPPPDFQLETDGLQWRWYDRSDGMTLVHGQDTRQQAVNSCWKYYRAKTNGDTGDFPHDERWKQAN